MNDNLSRAEHAGAIFGVAGRFYPAHAWNAETWSTQKWISESREIGGYGTAAIINVEANFDDKCRNGHNTFFIGANVYRKDRLGPDKGMLACGCNHEDIARAFPELAPLIKWHGTSSDGPTHYPANAIYHAGDRDCYGLRAGEKRQLVNGRSGLPMWDMVAIDTATGDELPVYRLPKLTAAAEIPALAHRLEWRPCYRIGEGKTRELDHARSAAVWPEATDDELCAEPDALRAVLMARLPALLERFRADITRAGFTWSPSEDK